MEVHIYIGTSGWSYNHWIGRFYPEELRRGEWFEFYCNHFNTVEVNFSFYRFPFPNMLKSWYRRSAEQFNFTFKANRLITHVRRLKDVDDLIRKFLALVNLMGDKLACILWQLPPGIHFSEQNVELLDAFIGKLDKAKRNVIEFRHKSWWNKETYELLKRHEVAFCAVSAPGLPDDFIVTARIAYVRFHGKRAWYRHDYSEVELMEWVTKMEEASNQYSELYCYFNNDYEAYAIKNALQLRHILKIKP